MKNMDGKKENLSFAQRAIRSPKLIYAGIIISVILIYIGAILSSTAPFYDSSTSVFFMFLSAIIYNLGILWLVLIFLGLGIGRHDYPQWVRVSLIVAAFLLILFGLMNFKDSIILYRFSTQIIL
ncbi:hypothetical protein [Aciduliprofundum sp. MAR08-339]|uniref:hypothetical protein n=1 Tax=Aciduliprofundum sp. (strain MAR08-339) TaxID=673860 RepID=UPI00138A4AD0